MKWDCQTCGACCAEFDVWLEEADCERFERQPALVALTVMHESPSGWSARFMLRNDRGRCTALNGDLGRCGCSIYADRPALCRAFEAGSPDCLAARRKHGFPESPSVPGE